VTIVADRLPAVVIAYNLPVQQSIYGTADDAFNLAHPQSNSKYNATVGGFK
jgi:hypothetical protein